MAGTHIRLVGSTARSSSVRTSILLGSARPVPRRRTATHISARMDDILSSTAAFIVSVAICWVACGVGAYYWAQWTLGMT